MPTTITTFRRLRKKGMRYCVNQGQPPTVKFTNNPSVWVGGLVFLLASLVVFVTVFVHRFWFKGRGLYGAIAHAFHDGLWAGAAVALLYYLLPALTIFGFLLLRWKRPPKRILSAFPDGQKVMCLFLLAMGLVYGLNHLYHDVLYKLSHHRWPHHWLGVKPYVGPWWELGLMALGGAFILGVLTSLWLPEDLRPRKTRFKVATRHFLMEGNGKPFGLWLGSSTGRLSALWHKAGMAGGLNVVLSAEDAAQNILVLGGIGAGKTTRLMQPLLAQLLDQECGGLVFDVKGDVKKAALQLGEMAKWPITVIGPGHNQMNLLEGLTPEVAASFLKSAFLLSGGAKLDSFWVDTATELCRNTLGLLSFLPEHYTLQGLYSYLFDPEMKQVLQCKLKPLLETLGQAEQRLLKTYLRYHDTVFLAFDEKVKSGVNATVAQALSPFNHPEVIDAFCGHSHKGFNMQSVVDGSVYLIDLPLSRWGLGGKVAYTFIKLRFFNVMQSRVHRLDWNQCRPVFFMCDEYQELISANKDGLSDLNFWDKSRSSKAIGIVSAQSVSSFYAALGDRDLAHAILQNFRQKVCFRTEDQAALAMMDRLAGQAKIKRKAEGQTTGKAKRKLGGPESNHHSATQNIAEVREPVLDAVLFRNLSANQAVALLSLQGRSMDDVLELLPLYV